MTEGRAVTFNRQYREELLSETVDEQIHYLLNSDRDYRETHFKTNHIGYNSLTFPDTAKKMIFIHVK